MVKVCPNCGTKNFDDAVACVNCETKFEDGGFVTDEAVSHDHISEYENTQTQEAYDPTSPKKSNTILIVAIVVAIVIIIAAIGGILFFMGVGNLINSGIGSLANLDYVNYDYNYGLNYPDEWTQTETAGMVQFLGPTTNNSTPNIVISGPEDSEGYTVDGYVQKSLQTYSSIFTNFSLEYGSSTTINGFDSYEVVYTIGNATTHLKEKQVFISKGNLILILTYDSPVETYDTYLPNFEESLNSLVWI